MTKATKPRTLGVAASPLQSQVKQFAVLGGMTGWWGMGFLGAATDGILGRGKFASVTSVVSPDSFGG